MLAVERIDVSMTVCKVADYTRVDFAVPFTFAGATDAECSLVCPTQAVPTNAVEREDGWRAFRIVGQLDFSLVGILAPIAKTLADARIGIFAVSTFDTDYVLVKESDFEQALALLADAGYKVI